MVYKGSQKGLQMARNLNLPIWMDTKQGPMVSSLTVGGGIAHASSIMLPTHYDYTLLIVLVPNWLSLFT